MVELQQRSEPKTMTATPSQKEAVSLAPIHSEANTQESTGVK